MLPSSSPVARYVNSVSVNWACDISQRARCANSDGTRTSQWRASPKSDVSPTTSAGTPSPRNITSIAWAEAASEKDATTSQDEFEVDGMGTSNDKVERRGDAPPRNEADLSKSSTPLLGSSQTRPTIAPTDC
jgi:hypothetical protein